MEYNAISTLAFSNCSGAHARLSRRGIHRRELAIQFGQHLVDHAADATDRMISGGSTPPGSTFGNIANCRSGTLPHHHTSRFDRPHQHAQADHPTRGFSAALLEGPPSPATTAEGDRAWWPLAARMRNDARCSPLWPWLARWLRRHPPEQGVGPEQNPALVGSTMGDGAAGSLRDRLRTPSSGASKRPTCSAWPCRLRPASTSGSEPISLVPSRRHGAGNLLDTMNIEQR